MFNQTGLASISLSSFHLREIERKNPNSDRCDSGLFSCMHGVSHEEIKRTTGRCQGTSRAHERQKRCKTLTSSENNTRSSARRVGTARSSPHSGHQISMTRG